MTCVLPIPPNPQMANVFWLVIDLDFGIVQYAFAPKESSFQQIPDFPDKELWRSTEDELSWVKFGAMNLWK